jgi:hypothetical protein
MANREEIIGRVIRRLQTFLHSTGSQLGPLYINGIFFFVCFTISCQLLKVLLKITKKRDSRELRINQPISNMGILLEFCGMRVCPVIHAKD